MSWTAGQRFLAGTFYPPGSVVLTAPQSTDLITYRWASSRHYFSGGKGGRRQL